MITANVDKVHYFYPFLDMKSMQFSPGMAYQLNLVDNRLPIFDKSPLPITDFYRF